MSDHNAILREALDNYDKTGDEVLGALLRQLAQELERKTDATRAKLPEANTLVNEWLDLWPGAVSIENPAAGQTLVDAITDSVQRKVKAEREKVVDECWEVVKDHSEKDAMRVEFYCIREFGKRVG